MHPELVRIKNLVVDAAREELLPRFNKVSHSFKVDGSVITEADLVMQERLQSALKQAYPSYAFLGEEMSKQEQYEQFVLPNTGLWCLDPLDGTSNFSLGIPCFSVSLALIVNAQLVMGVVYDPMRDECFCAQRGAGAWLNDEPIQSFHHAAPAEAGIAIVDYKRLEPELRQRLTEKPPFKSQRSFGSVALDWCWLAAGRGHVYLHGSQNLWDYAAGNLIFMEAGGYAQTFDAEPVFNNSLAPRSAIAALDENLFKKWLDWLGVKPLHP
jgi:myo-inositol-1(or 4)-monophosphatase